MSYDPIPASGAGAERFDLPSLFYLTHQATIDEWHALQINVAEAVSEWYRSTVRDALTATAASRGLDLSDAHGPYGHHYLVLHPTDTPVFETAPVIGIGLAWNPKKVNPTTSPPSVVVRRSDSETGKQAAEVLLDAGGRDLRTATASAQGGDGDPWPVYWPIRIRNEWWADLDKYRDYIVNEVLRMTDALLEALRRASRVDGEPGSDEEPAYRPPGT